MSDFEMGQRSGRMEAEQRLNPRIAELEKMYAEAHELALRWTKEFERLKGEVLKAVDDEEEFNGEMPEDMMRALEKADMCTIVKALRSAVRLSKQGIRKRIEELYGIS